MPRAIDPSTRKVIVELHGGGKSLGGIAKELGLSFSSVRRIWRRWRDRRDLELHYDACGKHSGRATRRVRRAALVLKRRHRSWGAGFILAQLRERWPALAMPHRSTLCRWFSKAGLIDKHSRSPAQSGVQRASEVHQIWEIDAKEGVRLGDKSWACWLLVSDERSGAILAWEVFPPKALESSRSMLCAAGAAPDL